MSLSTSRISKRSHQACENCRRKKTRCPGERPACSTCTRLSQSCQYSRNYDLWEGIAGGESAWIDRLQQLEEKMNLVLERSTSNCSPDTRELSATGDHHVMSTASNFDERIKSASTMIELPAQDQIKNHVALYFQYCHQQPLWLFEPDDFVTTTNLPDEVVHGISCLALRHSRRQGSDTETDQLCRQYTELAHGLINLRITRGTVNMSTMQALCCIALAEYVANDTHLAWVHIGLVTNLIKCGNIDIEQHGGKSTPNLEARRKLFWSVSFLNQQFGPRCLSLDILQDVQRPRYMTLNNDNSSEMGVAPPQIPLESGSLSPRGSIWIYMVQLGSLWREVQHYISHCASGHFTPPWSVRSGYTMIGAHLMDLETNFPTTHRWDSVKFYERSANELQRDRGYWSPWLYLQFTYHAVHSVINHPFLYSWRPQQSAQLSVPNTFWKTSSELALIHTTWTVRLIDLLVEKDYQLSDPSIGHLVAIALTIQLYYCRAADPTVSASAQQKVEKCVDFLGHLAEKWPMSRAIHKKVRMLVQSAFAVSPGSTNTRMPRRTISIDTALMWDILLQTSSQQHSNTAGKRLFEPSFFEPPNDRSLQADNVTVETEMFHHPLRPVDTLDGGQALPPYSSTVPNRLSSESQESENWRNDALSSINASVDDALVQGSLSGTVCGWSPQGLQNDVSYMNVTRDPFFQFQDQDRPYLGTWEIGNL
ncbi:Fungal Zn(2)-Cys(6) binuclear cluster domain-containing protein [Penicillium ucsense]|uniref:Fungal Zn(2)-Cys(6) binuclear cluster domain-containing protein n=1 Tax=Penicillium ucsense TaxID=2839758 RepID=A0A8J8W2N3_9EURO|nr:Fungal Zn(2)-Cys(6) binuclear cluster domain-containing protein [Penicillium ucsense]KAF7735563.1 Fungal Zn(2)-Cys(6) binuclear cluster domain-containing protein [Penicillium ucsense]